MSKRKLFVLFVVLASLLVVAVSWAAPQEIANSAPGAGVKQIAAPPADILSGQLALPQPEQAGIRSRTTMIPVDLQQARGGRWVWSGELVVDSGQDLSVMVFAPAGADWQLEAWSPGGELVDLSSSQIEAGVSARSADFGIGENSYPGQVYTFAQAETGVWSVRVTSMTAPITAAGADGYLLLSNKSPYQLFSHLSSYDLLVGHQVGLVTYAYDGEQDAGSGAPAPLNGLIESAEMLLVTPGGGELQVAMADDGRHGDGLAGDGLFGALVTAELPGDYIVQVTVHGRTPEGVAFMRTSEHVFPVVQSDLILATDPAAAYDVDGVRLQIELVASGQAQTGLQAFAEVWGTGRDGQMAPVAWIGGIVEPVATEDGLRLPLSLDGSWLALAQTQAPYELRNVRVQDLNSHIPLTQADRLALDVRSLPAAAFGRVTAVSEEMLMGVRPEGGSTSSFGGVLMLVHGYCSGGVWPTSDFSSYAVFQDYNQSRSHDTFANLIRNFGNQFSSFGVVAHSQGGAASLHLYTYYWSGLDYSSGSRLIQSVGTPYQGTALAGNLAVLGQVFGAGCGTNWDLTYDGAGLWLSGIPSWARGRVYYSTTAFKDVWWRYDYCHLATDLFLNDPDDGTTEKWAGQLSGANNMGHKSGWCHTSGMRDTAQYLDHSRNSNMNAYANR